jgi:ketosteroid isomerase-like protein
MRVQVLAVLVISCLALPVAAQQADDTAAVMAAVNAFHKALSSGDSAAAMRLIADDALMLEVGGIETRAEYEANHLPADIEFEKGVTTQRKNVRVVVTGNAAWAVNTSDVTGTFQGKPVSFVGIELMVLSREPAGWQIRAIHWSSRQRRPQ